MPNEAQTVEVGVNSSQVVVDVKPEIEVREFKLFNFSRIVSWWNLPTCFINTSAFASAVADLNRLVHK